MAGDQCLYKVAVHTCPTGAHIMAMWEVEHDAQAALTSENDQSTRHAATQCNIQPTLPDTRRDMVRAGGIP